MGTYPEVSLKLAREKHEEARELLARGVDPGEYKQVLKAEKMRVAGNSLEGLYLLLEKNTFRR